MRLRATGVPLALVFLTACGARAPEVPRGADSSETRELLDQPADFAFVARVDRLRADPVYGPLVRELSDRDVGELFGSAMRLDGVGTLEGDKPTHISAVVTLRAGAALTERRSPTLERTRRGVFSKDGDVLPNGVWEMVSLTSDGWPIGLYGMPGALVFVSGRAAGHGHAHFSTHSSPPPPVDFGDDVLAGLWMGEGAARSPALAETMKQRGSRGFVSGELRLRTGAHGDLVGKSLYDTEEHAQEAVDVAKDKLGMYASIWARVLKTCPGLDVVTVENERRGRVVSTRIGRIPDALRALKGCR